MWIYLPTRLYQTCLRLKFARSCTILIAQTSMTIMYIDLSTGKLYLLAVWEVMLLVSIHLHRRTMKHLLGQSFPFSNARGIFHLIRHADLPEVDMCPRLRQGRSCCKRQLGSCESDIGSSPLRIRLKRNLRGKARRESDMMLQLRCGSSIFWTP